MNPDTQVLVAIIGGVSIVGGALVSVVGRLVSIA